jgi:purine-binding chemotaxis protein CheW
LVFRAGTHLCALDVAQVLEVMRPLPVRPLPGVPTFVSGVSVVRGEPIPVVDVARLVGGGDQPATRYVTVRGGRYPAALAAGSVLGVRRIPPASAHDLPPLLGAVSAEAIDGMAVADGEPLLLLRSARIVPDAVWTALESELANQ